MFLAFLLVGSFVGMRFLGVNFLLILIIAGFLNLIAKDGWPQIRKTTPSLRVLVVGVALLIPIIESRLFQISWLFLKTGFLSFGGAYASLVFVRSCATPLAD